MEDGEYQNVHVAKRLSVAFLNAPNPLLKACSSSQEADAPPSLVPPESAAEAPRARVAADETPSMSVQSLLQAVSSDLDAVRMSLKSDATEPCDCRNDVQIAKNDWRKEKFDTVQQAAGTHLRKTLSKIDVNALDTAGLNRMMGRLQQLDVQELHSLKEHHRIQKKTLKSNVSTIQSAATSIAQQADDAAALVKKAEEEYKQALRMMRLQQSAEEDIQKLLAAALGDKAKSREDLEAHLECIEKEILHSDDRISVHQDMLDAYLVKVTETPLPATGPVSQGTPEPSLQAALPTPTSLPSLLSPSAASPSGEAMSPFWDEHALNSMVASMGGQDMAGKAGAENQTPGISPLSSLVEALAAAKNDPTGALGMARMGMAEQTPKAAEQEPAGPQPGTTLPPLCSGGHEAAATLALFDGLVPGHRTLTRSTFTRTACQSMTAVTLTYHVSFRAVEQEAGPGKKGKKGAGAPKKGASPKAPSPEDADSAQVEDVVIHAVIDPETHLVSEVKLENHDWACMLELEARTEVPEVGKGLRDALVLLDRRVEVALVRKQLLASLEQTFPRCLFWFKEDQVGVQWPQAATLHLRFCEGWPLPGGLLEVMQAQLCKGQDGMSGRGDPEFQKEVAAILASHGFSIEESMEAINKAIRRRILSVRP